MKDASQYKSLAIYAETKLAQALDNSSKACPDTYDIDGELLPNKLRSAVCCQVGPLNLIATASEPHYCGPNDFRLHLGMNTCNRCNKLPTFPVCHQHADAQHGYGEPPIRSTNGGSRATPSDPLAGWHALRVFPQAPRCRRRLTSFPLDVVICRWCCSGYRQWRQALFIEGPRQGCGQLSRGSCSRYTLVTWTPVGQIV